MKHRFPGWLMLLAALTAVGPLSIDMYLPSFPAIAEALHTTRGSVERSLPMFLAGLALGQLFYGPLSDRFGRRPPLLVGLSIYIAGCLGCALATSIDQLNGFRLLQALGAGVGMVVSRAVIRDRLDPRESGRAIASLILVMGLAPILAPLAGGWVLAAFDWHGIFYFQAAFGCACLLWAVFTMSETRPLAGVFPLRLGRVLRTYASLLADRRLMLPTLCSGLAMGGMFAYIAGSPFVLIGQYGVSEQDYGLLFGGNALGLILSSQLNGYWLRHRQPVAVMRHAVWVPGLAGLALLLMGLFGHPPLTLLMAGLFAYIAVLGTIMPNASAIAMAEQGHAAGAASALMGCTSYLIGMASGLGVSLLDGHSVLPMVAAMAVCGVLATGFGVWSLQRPPVVVTAEVTPDPPPA